MIPFNRNPAAALRLLAGSAFLLLGMLVPSSGIGAASGAEPAGLPSPSDEWVTRSWQTEDGLPQDTVNAIAQTRDGFLWVGTSAGLARFDGVQFRTFGLQDGLRSIRISALAEDRRGTLWIGTTGGGLTRRENSRFASFGAAEGFPAGADVVSMTADRDDSVWIGTSEGMLKWNQGAFRQIGEAQGLPRDQIRAVVQDSSGAIWVSVLSSGIYRGINEQFERVEGAERGGSYSLAADPSGSVWAGFGNGLLWHWHDGAWRHFEYSHGLPRNSFMAMVHDGKETLWICADAQGLYRQSGDGFVPATSGREWAGQNLRSVTVDRQGSVWVGTISGGLRRLSRRVLDYWDADAGLDAAAVTSVAEDASGVWWVGAGASGIYRFEAGRFNRLEDPAVSKTTHHIYSVTASDDGSIWAAGEGCLYHFQPGQPTKAILEAPVRGEAIRALCADGVTLWLGTYYSTLLKCDGSGVQIVAPRGSFAGDITSIVCEAPDTLWIGSAGGLHRWERGKIVRSWDTTDGLLTASVRALHRDTDGTIWIGTLGGGLARLKDGRILNFTTRHGLIDDVISQITADDFGCLWLGSNRGLMRVERREFDDLADEKISELHPLVFGRNEGILKEQCSGGHSPTAIKTRDGRILVPTVNGIAGILPGRLNGRLNSRLKEFEASPPQVSIESFIVDDESHNADGSISLPPGNHRLAVGYTIPVLSGGEWVRFRHRLDGLDHEWVAAGGRRLATFDGLPPGHYVFRVTASDSKGSWNEPGASLAFTVRPFFWQTNWFRAGTVILLVGSGAVMAWWRAHHKHVLQLAELERSRRHQAEVAHAGRVALLGELSASLAHELKQPLAAILSNAQAAVRFLNNDPAEVNEVRDILKDIAASDRRASEIIGRMQAMVKKGRAQMELRDLNADIEQVLLLIHGELAARNIVVETILSPDLPPVHGDHIQLQQVLLNLVINGCDAMNASPPDERRLVIETTRDGSNVIRVSVADQGVGISPEMLGHIFEPFYSTKDSGLGMGLAVCQAIIKAHGGRLWAANNPGRGATFHFTLVLEAQRHP